MPDVLVLLAQIAGILVVARLVGRGIALLGQPYVVGEMLVAHRSAIVCSGAVISGSRGGVPGLVTPLSWSLRSCAARPAARLGLL